MEPESSLPYSQAPAICPCPEPTPSSPQYFTSGLFCPQRKHLAHEYFLTVLFLREGVVSASPNPQAGGLPLVGCPRLLIQFIRSYPPYRRPFLHPQPEDAPWRGDRDPQTRTVYEIMWKKYGRARQTSDDNVMWRMRLGCYIMNVTDTHTEYVVILIGFPRQHY